MNKFYYFGENKYQKYKSKQFIHNNFSMKLNKRLIEKSKIKARLIINSKLCRNNIESC